MDYSNEKQLVKNEVMACVTDLISEMLADSLIMYEEFENASYEEEDYKEPLEYWIVSSFLGDELAKHGELVYKRRLGDIWGRTCSGQAIFLDGVIHCIAKEVYKE